MSLSTIVVAINAKLLDVKHGNQTVSNIS
jgi:hypothetical protein